MTRYHFVGIGGTGLSAIARVLLESGHQVSGSDLKASPLSHAVESAGAQMFIGHRAEHVGNADLVVRSSAIPDENVEVQEALRQGIPVLKRADFLEELVGDKICLAVAGSHGKTTSTALLAYLLTQLGQDPSYIVGGTVKNLNTNAHAGSGKYFVIEADEYGFMFLGLSPSVAVITNVEHDHPDLFPSEESFFEAFRQFITRVEPQGTLVYCIDDAGAKTIVEKAQLTDINTVSYGIDPTADYHAVQVQETDSGVSYTMITPGGDEIRVHLQLAGKHNVWNSMGILAIINQLDLPLVDAASLVSNFEGTDRRFEIAGQHGGITVIDDYAHHPTEIRATIDAARQRFPDARMWVVWQPHTFSRTITLQEDYRTAFVEADELIVTDVFAAREVRPSGFEMSEFVKQIENDRVQFVPQLEVASRMLVNGLKKGDVLLVLSAGDANRISRAVVEELKNQPKVMER